eukprot:CAMPEP_0183704618 /NCGR_PEP_ID=MMETSP0737-20130205/1910_1 /TAXON_ID=385413 /ORGANISM="Thalassiosira miniscula, Strain CCMP1093" /LENGTH=39 /DNA_ID= /DNA_START= /DNA_END= /DNA_ORIENTATION=
MRACFPMELFFKYDLCILLVTIASKVYNVEKKCITLLDD